MSVQNLLSSDAKTPLNLYISSVQMANSTGSYVPAALNYYEEYAATATATGAYAGTVSIKITRIGRLVNVEWLTSAVFTAIASTSLNLVAAIPARFRPATNINGIYSVVVNNVTTSGVVEMQSDGDIVFTASVAGGTFTNGQANNSLNGGSVSFVYNL